MTLSNTLRYILFVLIVALPLYIIRFSFFGLPSTVVEALVFVLVVVWGLKKFIGKEKYNPSLVTTNPFIYPIALFVLAGIISVIIAPSAYRAFGLFRAFILEPVMVYFIMLDMGSSDSKKTFVAFCIKALLVSGIWVSLLGMYQWLSSTNFIAPLEASQGRVTSVFNNPNFLALFLAPLIIFAIGEFVKATRHWSKVFYGALVYVFSAVFVLTKSSGGLLGLITALIGMAILYKYQRIAPTSQKPLKRILMGTVILGMSILVFLFVNVGWFTPKYKLVWPRPDKSTRVIRLCVWEGTRSLLLDHPVLGVGLAGFEKIYPDYRSCDTELFVYPHNIFLNFWVELGLLGLVSFFWLSLKSLVSVMKLKGAMVFKIVVGAIYIYWFAHGLVDVPYFKNDLSILYWIVLALVSVVKEKQNLKPVED